VRALAGEIADRREVWQESELVGEREAGESAGRKRLVDKREGRLERLLVGERNGRRDLERERAG